MSTKSLAKELGLIRKRSQSCTESLHHRSVGKQHFSYLIIIDFESTCWREKNNFGQEIIEFPAVLINATNGEIESEFHTFVQPQEHPVLSEFCTELTGITQDQVESAPPIQICLSKFQRWLNALQQEKGVVFETDSKSSAPSGHPCAFITWSDWDLGVCLLYECKRKQMSVPEPLKSWIDLRATYRRFYNRKPKGLRGALQDLGIQFTGREHSGLVDARNTALLAWRMIVDGCVLTVTKSLRRVQVKSRPVPNSSSRPSTVCKDQTSVCRVIVSPRTILSSTTTPSCVIKSNPNGSSSRTALAGLSDTTYDPETLDACWTDGVLLTEEEEPSSYDDVILGAGPESVDQSVRNCTAEPNRSRAASELFKKPEPPSRPDPYASILHFLGRKSSSFSVFKDTPAHPSTGTGVPAVSRPPLSSTVNHSGRRTSPLCGCGRRSRRLTVGNGGPNHGRVFYSCPMRRQSCDGRQKGCEFFQWETSTQNLIRTSKNCGTRTIR